MTGDRQKFDLAIVGAGPAGMAGAALAGKLGLNCVVLDEQSEPGGQIYRALGGMAAAAPDRPALFGAGYSRGLAVIETFRAAGIDYRPATQVWQIDPPGGVWTLQDGRCGQIEASRLLVCSGALERPVPLPGWTLPGVLGVGAAQILLKSAGLVPEEPMVLIGNGPLLYLLVAQYRTVGVTPAAVLLTGRPGDLFRAAPHLPGFLASGMLPEAIKLLRAMGKSGMPIYRGVSHVTLTGETEVEGVCFTSKGRRQTLPARLVCLHEGVVPNTQITRAIGCEHHWDRRQRAFLPTLDRWGNTTVDAIQVAGDSGGIAGALAGELTGRLAVLDAARALGRITEDERDRRGGPDRKNLARLVRARPFVDTLYAPGLGAEPVDDATIICRCEEVTAGQVRRAVSEGCQGPNQVKSFLRCGMGACQGRYCGLTVSQIIAAARGVPMDEVGYYRIRPPFKPVDLGALADMAQD